MIQVRPWSFVSQHGRHQQPSTCRSLCSRRRGRHPPAPYRHHVAGLAPSRGVQDVWSCSRRRTSAGVNRAWRRTNPDADRQQRRVGGGRPHSGADGDDGGCVHSSAASVGVTTPVPPLREWRTGRVSGASLHRHKQPPTPNASSVVRECDGSSVTPAASSRNSDPGTLTAEYRRAVCPSSVEDMTMGEAAPIQQPPTPNASSAGARVRRVVMTPAASSRNRDRRCHVSAAAVERRRLERVGGARRHGYTRYRVAAEELADASSASAWRDATGTRCTASLPKRCAGATRRQ